VITDKAAAFAFLREKFLGNLPRRVAAMRATIDGAGEEPLDRQFHSLAGIGGTYGFHEITHLAKAGEAACAAGRHTDVLHAIVNAIETAGAQ
jgi:hypothetical protein